MNEQRAYRVEDLHEPYFHFAPAVRDGLADTIAAAARERGNWLLPGNKVNDEVQLFERLPSSPAGVGCRCRNVGRRPAGTATGGDGAVHHGIVMGDDHPAQVEDQSLDAGPGDVIVTPAGTAHSYEVLGDEPARVVCVDSPPRSKPDA